MPLHRLLAVSLFILFSISILSPLVDADSSDLLLSGSHNDSAVSAPPPPTPSSPDYLSSPRATIKTFQNALVKLKQYPNDDRALTKAISTLDLSEINELVRNEKGPDFMWLLSSVLDAGVSIKLKNIPKKTQKNSYTLFEHEQATIRLIKFTDGRWLFSADSLQSLDILLPLLQTEQIAQQSKQQGKMHQPEAAAYLPFHLRIQTQLPEFWKQPMLTLQNWQWLGILIIIIAGVFADKFLSLLLRIMVGFGRRRARGYYRDIPLDMLRPLGLMLMSAIWWIGLNGLGLPSGMLSVLLSATKFLAAVSSVWGAYRLVDLLSASFKEKAADTASRVDDMLVPLFTKSIKLFVTVIGIVFIASQMNRDVSGLLAGLGLGGLAFALASKDAVENLFGSITILFDRPFIVGDWVVIGDIEGTVETIGFRSTRIRTFYNSQITLPNSRLITAHVDNMGRRRYRRFRCTLRLSYDTTPPTIEAFCEGVRQIVRLHPHTRKDYFHIYFNEYNESSLDIMVYIFFDVIDWGEELRERHHFLLDVLQLAAKLNVDFAYPSRTVHIKTESPQTKHPVNPILEQLQACQQQDQALHIGRQEADLIIKNQ